MRFTTSCRLVAVVATVAATAVPSAGAASKTPKRDVQQAAQRYLLAQANGDASGMCLLATVEQQARLAAGAGDCVLGASAAASVERQTLGVVDLAELRAERVERAAEARRGHVELYGRRLHSGSRARIGVVTTQRDGSWLLSYVACRYVEGRWLVDLP